jgi:hypothetical protein
VRANKVSSEELLTEINELRKQNSELSSSLSEHQAQAKPAVSHLAALDDSFTVSGRYSYDGHRRDWTASATWRELFGYIAPYLVKHPNDAVVKDILEKPLFARSGRTGTSPSLDDQVFQTISVQLRAYGLVEVRYTKTTQGGMGLFWSATPAGDKLTFELRTVRAKGTV